MADLKVRPERSDDRVVLAVSGELDLGTVAILHEAAAEPLADTGLTELVVDLAGLAFLDSTGLGALLQVRSEALERGLGFRVQNVSGGPARIISIAGLNGSFGIDSPSDA